MSAAMAAATGVGLPTLALAADDQKPDKWVKGVCRYCGTGCGVMVGVKNGKAVAIQGDPNNHNAGLLCLKGSLLIPVLNSKERVTQPMVRRKKGAPLEPVSWDEALDLMASKFRPSIDTYGANSVAWYGSGQCLTEERYLASKIFKELGYQPTDRYPHMVTMALAFAINIAGVAEAYSLAKKAGVDPARVYQAIRSGLAKPCAAAKAV